MSFCTRIDPLTGDPCGGVAEFAIYAAYGIDRSDVHPKVSTYPMPMSRACAEHVIPQIRRDSDAPGTTGRWMIEVIGD